MTTLFDAGDMQRLRREQDLTEQSPRQDFRSPDDSITMSAEREANAFQGFDFNDMLSGLMLALKERV